MKDDNTATVTPRSRNLSATQHLRANKVKRLQGIGARAKATKEAKRNPHNDKDSSKVDILASSAPKFKANTLAVPVVTSSKFRKRQKHKSWLPTHLYHARRAHMTLPEKPLWRFAIPMTPTEKSYRATHRASSLRGCISWDMSYISTIGIEGVEGSLVGLLRCLGVPEDQLSSKKGIRWRNGTRSWSGWVRERDNAQTWIAEIMVLWCALEASQTVAGETAMDIAPFMKSKTKRGMLIRVHPSAFLQVWTEILKVAKMQRPSPSVEDLRFEIGSIDIVGPGATAALVGALHPLSADDSDSPNVHARSAWGAIWKQLSNISNPACLPPNVILGFEVSDPRLYYPPRKVEASAPSPSEDDLLYILSSWPPDEQPCPLSFFDRKARLEASRALPSQKSINRRKGDALAGSYPSPLSSDPRIPVVLLASRHGDGVGSQGSWTVLLPWKCIKPVWYSLLHYPLSSGGNPRFGGLQEIRQISFENHVPWFPADFPGTKAGWEWEMNERKRRKLEWGKHPKGRRIEWESVDLGQGRRGEIGKGWACDWERLLDVSPESGPTSESDQIDNVVQPNSGAQSVTSAHINLDHLPPGSPKPVLALSFSRTLATVRLSFLFRGAPTTCARIYRFPTTDSVLREKWIALSESQSRIATKLSVNSKNRLLSSDAPSHERRTALAASILANPTANFENQPDALDDVTCPAVPAEEDLIGFVTTGNFNLGEGRGTGIGAVALSKLGTDFGNGKQGGLCIVRDAGNRVGRIARWNMA